MTPRSTTTRIGAPPRGSRAPVPAIVAQHVEESAQLRDLRTALIRAPQLRLPQLARWDERLAAHLDGITVAGEAGASMVLQSLEHCGKGEVFVATVGAIEDRATGRLDRLLAVAESVPAARAGLVSAFGWVPAAALQGITASLLVSDVSPWRREVGLMACSMHGVNAGSPLTAGLRDADPGLRATALRAAGRSGRVDLVGVCETALGDADARCAFEAARAALLLGNRTEALVALEAVAADAASPFQLAALRLALKVMPNKRLRALLATMAKEPANLRPLIQGIASAGDPHYVPWLIAQMENPKLARLASDAFAFISGLDLAHLGFDRTRPDGVESSPNDDPDDEGVTMDEDENLPWPDVGKIATWWRDNGAHFAARTRYFVSAVPTTATCSEVLKTGFQRQRSAAAEYLVLLKPGTPLFNVAAPAQRQQRLLGLVTPGSPLNTRRS